MDGRIRRVNDLACRTLGLDRGGLVGQRLTDVLPVGDAPGERRYVRPDGGIVWLLVETHVEGDPADHVRVHLRDVTAARLVAEDERKVSAQYPVAIEGSWVLDATGRTVSIGAITAALLGYTAQEILGRSPLEFVADEDRLRLREALRRRRDGRRESYEIRWRHRDGESIWALMSAAPIRDAAGRYAGAFALVTDVTERRRTDEQLERQRRQQEAIADLGRIALRGPDLASLHDVAVRTASTVLRADFTAIFEAGPDRLELIAAQGIPAGGVRDLTRLSEDTRPASARIRAGRPLIVPDWELEPELPRPRYAVELGVRSTTAVPIRGRHLHGVIAAARREPWAPEEDEVRFLEAVANVLAAAMDRAEVEVEGRHRALHDPITGLPNRTLALDRLDQALRRGGDSTVAVIVVDLDRFKRINDTYGVAVGDEVVHAVGASLRALAPPTDTVARLAGDSFAVICAESGDAEAAGSMAARIVGVLRTPVHAAGEELSLTVSVGVAIGGAGDEAGDLLRDADTAVDRAKAHGRDRFELFDQALRARAVDRVQLERDLNGAAARGELYVVHQPIVSISGGHVTGTEALVRWRHPDRGVVPPGDFIGLAEETGLIAEIGTWVLRQACADVAARCRAGSPMTCHVNLSPRQAADASLPDLVAEVLRETGLPAEALVLELTESSLMEAGEGPLSVMQGVRALGVRLVLDDFGTGYSSLARLRSFPVDGLKIDRSFIADLDTDPQGALLVAGIVEMARALGLTVVAEGVETPLQLARLRLIGCRYAQGFLLARPADAAELDRLMASGSLLPAAA
jgi:diguanylate cyclase (GGDEF)-like protein/PAS domain S-box-containing protein